MQVLNFLLGCPPANLRLAASLLNEVALTLVRNRLEGATVEEQFDDCYRTYHFVRRYLEAAESFALIYRFDFPNIPTAADRDKWLRIRQPTLADGAHAWWDDKPVPVFELFTMLATESPASPCDRQILKRIAAGSPTAYTQGLELARNLLVGNHGAWTMLPYPQANANA